VTTARAPSRPLAGAIAACAAQFLVGVDGLAVAIALPAIQRDLGVAPIDAQWILTAYGLAFGGGLLLGGRLGDLYGRRRLLVAGLALFAAGAVLGGSAPGLEVLVAARALQGAGSAAAVPAALALIGSLFAAGAARTRALSILAAMASLGVTVGLLLGGVVTALLGWRWVFLLMVPLALATLAGARAVLPEVRAEQRPERPDVGGALLVTAGLVALLFGLTRIERHGVGSPATLGPLLAAAVLLPAFVAWERRTRAPLVRLEILTVRSLRTATLCVGVNAVAFTAIVYVGTLYLQTAVRYSPAEAGLALLPLDVVAAVVPLVLGASLAHRSPRALLAASFALTALALLWLARARAPVDYAVDLMAPLVALGASLSVAFVVLTNEAVAEVEPDEKGVASGIFETANHLFGGAVGVALYATILTATTSAATARDTSGYRAAFLAAAALALLGVAAALRARTAAAQSPRAARSAG
jgi:EmrB/QacA subfamily drug resistance transporter